jgi:hypothetical protein
MSEKNTQQRAYLLSFRKKTLGKQVSLPSAQVISFCRVILVQHSAKR